MEVDQSLYKAHITKLIEVLDQYNIERIVTPVQYRMIE